MTDLIRRGLAILGRRSDYDLTFVCRQGLDYFAQPILRELEQRHRIQYVLWNSRRELRDCRLEAGSVWYEWADTGAIDVTARWAFGRRTFIRLHRYELSRHWLPRIRWKRVAGVIFVNQELERDFQQCISSRVATCTVPNAVSCDRFPRLPRPDSLLKTCCLYSLRYDPRKGYADAIRFLARLLETDSGFSLRCMARCPIEPEEHEYLAELKRLAESLGVQDKVAFVLRDELQVDSDAANVCEFLGSASLFLGFSTHESFQYTMAEAILSGQKAFFRGWVANPARYYWERWCHPSEQAMVDAILGWCRLSAEQRDQALASDRRYVVEQFDGPAIARRYEQLFFG